MILGSRGWQTIGAFLAEENYVIVRDKRLKAVVEVLLEHESDPKAENKNGETALDLARGNTRTEKLLATAMASNSCYTIFKQ